MLLIVFQLHGSYDDVLENDDADGDLAPCNIPNFGPNTYRHEPIDYDVILMFYFDIPGRRPHCI